MRKGAVVVAGVLLAACSTSGSPKGSPGDGSAGHFDGGAGTSGSGGGKSGSAGGGASGAGGSGVSGAGGGGKSGAAGAVAGAGGLSGQPECNDMANSAPYVRPKEIASALPTTVGGAPSPGWYYLTEWDWYTGPDGGTNQPNEDLAETLALSVAGNVVTLQQVQNSGPVTANVSQTMTMTLTGTETATLQYSCPSSSAPGQIRYSANATTFTLYALGRGYVYTKQSDGPIDLVAACKAMQDDFDAALLAARKCDPTSTSACLSTAEVIQVGCASNCQIAVQDSNGLERRSDHFGQAGCMKLPGFTCATTCAGPMGQCQAQAGGGGLCVAK